jgi:modulator of FtsH protease
MNTPLIADWANFFVAEVGAAAALSGLLFVAVSINLARVLAIEHLPERAAETLYVLVGVLVVATFGLVPGQSPAAFGAEVVATGLALWGVSVRTQVRAYQNVEARRWLARRVVGTQAATVPFIVGGALLVSGHPSGLYWLVPGVLASFAAGIQNAWVLLIEILR